jgi:DNA (cytosine-5)-methyltransferase 1
MKHLGNICNINGAEVEPVDVIIGGSPCQDLSVAGKRAGLDGERSGLFMEQIRIVREQRNACIRNIGMSDTENRNRSDLYVKSGTSGICSDSEGGQTNAASTEETVPSIARSDNPIRPRFMVWENVPGAFSSNKAEDFRIVLEETARIADSNAVIPRPPGGKWTNAGAIMGDGWSIAWRVFDAQFWGVPQRRRRIALVADFGGQSAPEILFEREGVRGDIAESGTEGERVAGSVEGGARTASGSLTPFMPQTSRIYSADGKWPTLQANSNGGQNRQAVLAAGFCQGASPAAQTIGYQEEVSPTIKGAPSGTAQVPAVCYPINTQIITRHNALGERTGFGLGEDGDPAYTIQAGHEHGVAVFDARGNGDGSIAPTMTGDHQNRVTDYTGIAVNQSVRRLTPLECERLQGFPDNWTNIPPQTDVTEEDLTFWRTVWDEWDDMNGKKRHSDKQIIKWLKSEVADSARYKALGNSIALPPWRFVLSRIHNQGARTMASLFDGIGGFPKIWQELGGQTLWCSEVEPFPIAVTMYHFKEAHQ